MTGFYVYNNIGIAFRCFATGVLFGLGSVFFLVYNGLMIGAVAGLVTAAGHGKNLLTFTCTHGAFELTAIVISGDRRHGDGLRAGRHAAAGRASDRCARTRATSSTWCWAPR